MILIGQYDSPFVRRIAITLKIRGQAFDHQPWSVFTDADQVRQVSPLGRVPILVLDDGEALPDSHSILDFLDGAADALPLAPPHGPDRVTALRRTALATGLAEKAVALLYETKLHEQVSATMAGRIQAQIAATLDALDSECPAAGPPFWHGESPGHADIALACAARFIAEVHPTMWHHPAISRHNTQCEILPAFRATIQAFRRPE